MPYCLIALACNIAIVVLYSLLLIILSPGLPVVLHSLLLTVLLVQLSSSQSTLLPLKQSNLLAVLHAPLVVLNGLPIILQIVVLNGLIGMR